VVSFIVFRCISCAVVSRVVRFSREGASTLLFVTPFLGAA
jgi:hypothetical protein